MKNDENYYKNNNFKDKNKLTPLKLSDNFLHTELSPTNASLKSPYLQSPKGQDYNSKESFKANETQAKNSNNNLYKKSDFKSYANNINTNNNENRNLINLKSRHNLNSNNNAPPLYLNSNQVNNANNIYNKNNKFHNTNLTEIYASSPANKDFPNMDLFKLSNELNLYLDTNKSSRFNTLENRKNPHKGSKSLFSHKNNNLLTTSYNKNNSKNYFNLNTNTKLNSKNTTSYLNKSSNLRKSYYQKIEPQLEMVNLEKYSNLMTETMGNYRIESLQADLNNEKNDEILQTNNRTLGFTAFNKTLLGKSQFNNLNITYGENAFMKINVNEKEYVNPTDSLKILDTNKNIFDNLCTSSINIQKMYYDKTVNGIEKYNEFKKNMCKVRISNIMPKNTDLLMLFKSKESLLGDKGANLLVNGTHQSSNNLSGIAKNNFTSAANKGNLNQAGDFDPNKERSAESIEKEKILEKQRGKEREREREREREKKKKNEVKFKNKVIRSDEMELYAYYKYSTKNFPEGREQFAFDYNLSEIVLFGGIVTNKNNHVWTLDPSNFIYDQPFYDFLFSY